MYVPTAGLGLLSTWLLVRARASGRRADALGYVAATAAALWTQLYAWPLLLGQILWVVWDALRNGRPARLLHEQGLAILLGLPALQLAIYQSPPTRWRDPARGYWELGYLFGDRAGLVEDGLPQLALWRGAALACGVLVLVLALARPGREPQSSASAPRPALRPGWPVWVLALAIVGAMTLFPIAVTWGSAAPRPLLWACALLPLTGAALLGPIRGGVDALAARGGLRALPRLGLGPCLATLPVAIMLLASLARPSFVARGAVVFVPYFALCAAHAVERLWSRKAAAGLGALALLAALHGASVAHLRSATGSPRDYRRLAKRLAAELAPDDRVLVRNDFISPQLFHYLRAEEQLVHTGYAAAVAALRSRVWLVRFEGTPLDPEIGRAVAALRLAGAIEVRGARAELYERP